MFDAQNLLFINYLANEAGNHNKLNIQLNKANGVYDINPFKVYRAFVKICFKLINSSEALYLNIVCAC